MKSYQTFLSQIFIGAATSIFICGLAACSKHEFKVKGEIYGAEEKTLTLEKAGFQGQWMAVDSTHINKNGGFSLSFPAPASPEIYRLVLNNRYIYFPVDSTETLTINSSYENFGHDFSITGSHNAERMAQFDKDLQNSNTANSDSLYNFKRKVYSNYLRDSQGSIVSFYILTKTIDGKPLYDPSDSSDRKYFAAVATGYKAVNPDDPHANLLEQTALNALKQKNIEAGNVVSIEAQEISLIDIDLPDETGKNIKLSEIAGHGKSVVVIFSMLNNPDTPKLNMALAEIYNRHKGNVEFYNVSLDEDQYAWRDAAINLPWITVYSPGQDLSEDASRYNVYAVPAFFVYDKEGNLIDRPMSLEALEKDI